ncbi:hypothetical protein ACROAD_14755 [Shewanella baltica]|uniref:hypothetical protein n=1 Tax=Shewanella baltica TaxID=62322 RepID=UPI00217DBED3|nr:hypothetical protein [Shewanella baltica]MCS6180407.1 hypothetical protein [Shewanella baltica]MCS6256631.1 hypothetical protein [Shewanella baltica]
MCSLSNHAYSIHAKAKSLAKGDISRAQVLELIAAYYGQKSFASLKHSEVSTKLEKPNSDEANKRCIQRAISMGVNHETSKELSLIVTCELDSVNSVNPTLINRQVLSYLESNIELNEQYFSFEGLKIYIPSMLAALKNASNNGVKDSQLLELLLLVEHYASVTQGESSEHWYQRQLAGEVLEDVQKKWANNYAELVPAKQSLDTFVKMHSITDLPVPNIEELISSQTVSSIKQSVCYRVKAKFVKSLVVDLWELDENELSEQQSEFITQWETLATFQEPYREQLAELVESETDLLKQHSWLEFAKANGIDLEMDDMHLVDSYTGEVWEHDFDGPVFVDGYEGITLPQLPSELQSQVTKRVEAMLNIQKLISKL